MQIINWRAKRAGGRITIYGKNALDNADVRIVGVDQITKTESRKPAIAVDKDGKRYELV